MAGMVAAVESFRSQELSASERIKKAVRNKESLLIAGGQSRRFLGRSVSADEILSSEAFSGVLSYEPSELVLRVGAGTQVSAIQAMLAERNQCLAFEPHDLGQGRSTIGGAVASAMAGAARPWQGGVKDHVLGLGLINGKGDILKFGGQVMKNVAGYDVSRAMVGSLGCMGLITELSLKVLPIQAGQFCLKIPCNLEQALEMAARLDQGMTMRNGFAWYDGVAHVRFASAEQAVTEVLEDLSLTEHFVENDPFWRSLSHMSHSIFADNEAFKLWRIVAPKYTDLSDVFPERPVLMNWAGGEYFVRAGDAELEQCVDKLKRLGAYCYSLNEDDIYVLHGLSPTVERLHIALKRAFDPNNVFNIGRMSEAF